MKSSASWSPGRIGFYLSILPWVALLGLALFPLLPGGPGRAVGYLALAVGIVTMLSALVFSLVGFLKKSEKKCAIAGLVMSGLSILVYASPLLIR